ncbi:hypothetical protein BpHYR1_011369 [Brachionus plicatilis]|uniref:Uncharacterized protein n=1 Tax=Brachionus plicatilis TaxID=10195 RepID=A0A3M7SJC2_BRAPC|nr:hypothetical protein BpHYR1_011369 [Brachionus plicatilis]
MLGWENDHSTYHQNLKGQKNRKNWTEKDLSDLIKDYDIINAYKSALFLQSTVMSRVVPQVAIFQRF